MDTLWKDLRFAVRVLRKSPGFTAIVVLSLALGIGANTAIYTVFNAYLLRPMPVDAPDRLLAIYVSVPNGGANIEGFSSPQWKDFRAQETGLVDIAGSSGVPMSMTDSEKPELIWGEMVTGNYFSVVGVHPAVGRGFLPDEDEKPGEKPVCVLNYNFWQRRFHGDPEITGKSIKLEGQAFTIVGVAPRGFIGTVLFNFVPDVWVPAAMQKAVAPSYTDIDRRDMRWMAVRGRLKPGVSAKQAEAALNTVAARLAKEYPKTDAGLQMHVMAAGARTQPWLFVTGLVPVTTLIMGAVVILVLLIACANVANLMLARGATRVREMAIRVAVGAGRMRLVRQLLTESLLLSLGGGALGIILAMWFNTMLLRFYPTLDFQTVDTSYDSQLDPKILVFTALVSVAAAILFGLLPALRASRVDQAAAMKGDGANRLRAGSGNVLVMVQVALSCVLLVSGGLFLRSMRFAQNVDIGFYRTGISLFTINLDLQGYKRERAIEFERDMIGRLRAIPGVDDAAFAYPLPLDAYGGPGPVFPEGWTPGSDQEQNIAGYSSVSSRYFETMGTQIIAGRALDDRDTATSKLVAVINEAMAQRYWGSPDKALGRRFAQSKGGKLFEVVGIAKNGKYKSFGEPAFSYIFSPITQDYSGQVEVLLRSKQDIAALMPVVRAEMAKLDPTLPLFGVRTMPQFLNRTVSIYELGASLVGTFAVTALLLAAVGIYGVLYFTVARRTKEIGIRMALGARHSQVLRIVLQRSLLWVGSGLAIGIALALIASRQTGLLVAGIRGTDPLTFSAAVVIFAAVIAAASVIPARRAASVDPIEALRHE
ncbi:MAG TPA: ABC transporter permease [Bryobacteraceae bacterium]|jgi:predicted permease|nr:ABC transporter permease [Bryobacteraceae bacterium]